MMGLHQNYHVTWGAERMEGLTLDLGLDGMFTPSPAEMNPVFITKDSDPPSSWKDSFGHSQTQHHNMADVNLEDDDDPCALLHSDSNCVGGPERKPDMFELSLSYPTPFPFQRQDQHSINMKVEREEVDPSLVKVMPSIPDVDLTSQSEGSFNCWRNMTPELPHKEKYLYGTVRYETSEEDFLDDDTMDDFPEIKPDRCASSSTFPASAVQQHPPKQQMYPDIIVLDDSSDDDDCYIEERYTAEEEIGRVSKVLRGGDSSRRGSQETRGFVSVSQVMPLRQIKQRVRSTRSDDDYNDCATPSSAVLDITAREQQYGAKDLEIGDRNHHQAGEQVKQPNLPSPKRVRGYGDHEWLPSDLLDASHSERRNEAKRARGNGNDEEQNDFSQAAYRPRINVALSPSVPTQSAESGMQVQIQNPLIDVNQAIQEMPQDTAEAFKELIKLVLPFEEYGARASRAADEINGLSLTSDARQNEVLRSPPEPPPVSTTFSQQSSRAVDEMDSKRSIVSDFHLHTLDTPSSAIANQASRIADEMQNWRPLASDVQENDLLPSQHSATRSDFEEGDSPTLSSDFGQNDSPPLSSDFGQNDSPPLASVDQAIVPQGGPPSESATRSECSPHPTAVYEQQHAGKRTSNADVVLYEPKQEPVELWRENMMSGSVVHVKQEPQVHYEDIPDPKSIRPVVGSSTLAPCYSNRKLIVTALDTFEKVREQIIKDPSYGQPVVEPQTTTFKDGFKRKSNRLRADLKAASLMRKKGYWLNETVRPIGDVPGVAVGDCFRYRIEMAVIGLHRAVQAGIAVVPVNYSPYGVTLASSVVLGVSDPYQDDNDMGDTVIYSGQGGLCGKTKESQDQTLQRGNLALSNSFKLNLPVRLIRGHKEQNSITGILYSYDGLYRVVEMNYVPGVNGKKVYKFTMHRLSGQPPMCSGYPAPLGSQPPAREPVQNAVHWTEPDSKPLYLEKRPVA